MKLIQQFAVAALVVFSIFTKGMVNAHSIISSGAPPVYEQHIIINPLDGPSCSGSGCNCTAIRESVADTTHRLAKLETTVANKVDGVSAELNDVKLQLVKITESVIWLTELLKNATDNPTTHAPTPLAPLITHPTPQAIPTTLPNDCSQALANGMTSSGVYTVQPVDDSGPFDVYCDMETDGGGWTVFQRRQDGSVDFYRDWVSYRQGFGDLNGEFWLGNDNLHRLTAQGACRLRVDFEDFENNTAYAEYDMFSVADGSDNYRLTAEGFSGTAGDSLSYHSNSSFTTKNNDNDEDSFNCGVVYSGAWWYRSCHYSNLNGLYLGGQTDVFARGVVWHHWKGYYYSLKRTEMKIKGVTN